jgi:hypothetical protein
MRRSSFLFLLALSFLLLPAPVRGQNPISTVVGGGLPTPGAAYEGTEQNSSTAPFGVTERRKQGVSSFVASLGVFRESENES